MRVRDGVRLFLLGYFSTCDRSPRTLKAYRCDLRQFTEFLADGLTLSDISPRAIEEWVSNLKGRALAPASIKRKLAAVKVFLNYWVRKGALERSPMRNLRFDLGKARQLTRTLTLDEISRLIGAARNEVDRHSARPRGSMNSAFLAWRNLAIIELMFATGIRVGEVAALHLFHLSLEDRLVTVTGKGARQRLALLTDDRSFAAITHYVDRRKQLPVDTTALFVSIFRKPLTTQGVAHVIKTLCEKAGLEKHVTPHMIRHTVATLLLRNGADIRVVQEFLGHASITTTQRYTHVAKSHLAATLREYHPRLQIARG